MFMCGQWVSHLVLERGETGPQVSLSMARSGYSLGYGVPVVYPRLILFSEVSLVSQ